MANIYGQDSAELLPHSIRIAMFSPRLLEKITEEFPNAQIVAVVTYEDTAAHLHIIGTHPPEECARILAKLLDIPSKEEFTTDYIVDTNPPV